MIDGLVALTQASLLAAAWLYGAGCALCNQSERHSDALAGLVAQIANKKPEFDRRRPCRPLQH